MGHVEALDDTKMEELDLVYVGLATEEDDLWQADEPIYVYASSYDN